MIMFANMPRCLFSCLIVGLCFSSFIGVSAQSLSPTPTPSPTFTLSVGNTTATSISVGGGHTATIVTVVPTTYNISVSATSTPSPAPSSTATPTITLATKLDPAFGVLGALLILTGIPSTFLGHRNRWTSFFLIGFYTLSLVCFVLIVQFGILQAIHPPSTSLRGLFVLSCIVAWAAGGAIAIFFWKVTRYFIGGWGVLVFGLFIQCMRNGGLVGPISYRWIMYIGCGVVGFCLCTVPKIHYHVVLVATAFVGTTSFMLGVDCFSTAGLKEFYMWNLGFKDLFPTYIDNNIRFPVTQTMQIEIGLMAAVALMGIAVQLRILKILQRKLQEIATEQRRQHDEAEAKAAEQLVNLDQEKQEWEKQHDRQLSELSSTELEKGRDSSSTPLPCYPSTEHTVVGSRSRYQSGTSDFLASPNFRSQSPGPIPVLDLGEDIQRDVPRDFIAGTNDSRRSGLTPIVTADLAKQEALLAEIQNIRRSIEVLKSEPSPTTSYSRRPSVTSRRTLSQDLNSIAQYRTNSQSDARSRVQSTEMSGVARNYSGSSITRPTSVPLQDDWDSYVRDRKLLQPPSGVSAPIPTSSLPPTHRLSMSSAVLEAVVQRQKREGLLALGEVPSDDDSPLAMDAPRSDPPVRRSSHLRTKSAGNIPVAILPPRKNILSPTPERLSAPRVATYEELSERHREKMREMQSPLTQAEKQYAELSAAKERWERSKALEKQAVTRRQSLEAAAIMKEERKRKSEDLDTRVDRRSRTQSIDKLVATGGQSSKRMSTMKVEDWKKHQEEFDAEAPRSKRESRVAKPEASAVPFPNAERSRDFRRMSNVPREPPH